MFELRPFCLLGLTAWTTDPRNPDIWISWDSVSGCGEGAAPSSAPLALRRRTTAIGQKLLAAALSLPTVREARYVLSSRHAEFSRVPPLLEVIRCREVVSPTDFSMSVHNGLAGLVSIAAHNRHGHSAISAGSETFCYGLLEAVTCLAEARDEYVIQLHYDESPGEEFATLLGDDERDFPIVLALAFAPSARADGIRMRMSMRPRDDGPAGSAHALRFLDFVRSDAPSATSIGDRMVWEWHRA